MSVVVSNRQRLLKVNATLLKRITQLILKFIDAPDDSLGIVLVDDATIAKLNAQYHATPSPTDILTFDYGGGQGELIISVEHAVAQAKRYRTTTSRELALYVVHGILHLHGHDDRMPRQRQRMRAAERRLLNQITRSMHPTKLVK